MAGAITNYAAGNNIYGGGSPQATSGVVDPSGYIDRSLNAPSVSRSGLAQAAISRLQSPGAGASASYGGTPLGTNAAGVDPASANLQQQAGSGPSGSIPVPTVTPLSVTATGQITAPADSLPLDADLQAQQAALTNQANALLAGYANQEQTVNNSYATNAEANAVALPPALNALLANYAGRGLGFSSGYGNAYNQKETDYTDAMNKLLSTAQEGIAGIQTQAGTVPSSLQDQIAQLLSQQTTRNNALLNAGGTDGLGGSVGSVGALDPATSAWVNQMATRVIPSNVTTAAQLIAGGISPAVANVAAGIFSKNTNSIGQ